MPITPGVQGMKHLLLVPLGTCIHTHTNPFVCARAHIWGRGGDRQRDTLGRNRSELGVLTQVTPPCSCTAGLLHCWLKWRFAYRNSQVSPSGHMKEEHLMETEHYLSISKGWENYPEHRHLWQELCEGGRNGRASLGEMWFFFLILYSLCRNLGIWDCLALGWLYSDYTIKLQKGICNV